ncbi:MAG TPA: hypothetical protein VGM67_11790 [Gemmatimonadaceae bacterium]|jgi:hypothetical protein
MQTRDLADLADKDRSAVRLGALITLACAVSGAIAIPVVTRFGLSRLSIFYEQFARIEPPVLVLVTLFAIAALVALRGREDNGYALPHGATSGDALTAPLWPRAWWLAIVVLVVTAVGTNLIFHRFIFADDEYSAYFQALIFAHGKWSTTVPAEWCRWIPYITPTSIAQPQACTWHLSYLPIHSMLRALFIDAHLDWFSGPVTAAVTVLLVGATARRLWPDEPRRMWIAMAVLATSTQFLVMSMTMYSMPTHLLVASVWLWLYVVDRRWSIALLPIVGVIAMGVHSPIPHALLVPIFWLRYVRQKRYGPALYLAVVYAAGIVFWYIQIQSLRTSPGAIATAPTTAATAAIGAAGAVTMFHLPSMLNLYTSAMNIALIATWNTPVAVICAFVAGIAWHRLGTFERDAALTLLFVLVARAFSNSLQGEGWGYRFIYAGLGIFALLASAGTDVLVRVIGSRRTTMLLASSLTASVLVELPLRGVQVEWIIHPYYEAYNFLSHQSAEIVVFRSSEFMWGRQLLRNDPFLVKRPIIMSMNVPSERSMPADCESSGVDDAANAVGGTITVARAQAIEVQSFCTGLRAMYDSAEVPFDRLMREYPGRVRVVSRNELLALGLLPFVPKDAHVLINPPVGAPH